jgi:hypothetical protein
MIKSRIMRGEGGIWHVLGRGEVHTLLWWGDLREGDHTQGLGVGWRIILVDLKICWEKAYWIDLAQSRG